MKFEHADKPIFDPATGAYNEDVVKRMADESLLQQRINAGACGGADNVGGPCEESARNLQSRLYDMPDFKAKY